MLDPNMAYELGKIRQHELIEMGQNRARARSLRVRRPKFLVTLLVLLSRTFSR